MVDRRAVLAGLGALAVSGGGARAAQAAQTTSPPAPSDPPLFANGPLAGNQIAAEFSVPNPKLRWPKVRLLVPGGRPTTLDAYRGKLLLVALWAEWCGPCLTELPGLAYHAQRSNNAKFEIVPILTASQRYEKPSEAEDFLAKIGAKGLPTLMDGSSEGDWLCEALSKDPKDPKSGRGVLPCMLLIDPAGEIRGRAIGGSLVTVAGGKEYNYWSTNVGLEFIHALADGSSGLNVA